MLYTRSIVRVLTSNTPSTSGNLPVLPAMLPGEVLHVDSDRSNLLTHHSSGKESRGLGSPKVELQVTEVGSVNKDH